MTRALLPGRWSRDKSRAVPTPRCLGACELYGRPCTCQADTELASEHAPKLEVVRSVPSRPPIQISGGRVPLRRRARRFFAALWAFLSAGCFEP